MASVSAGQTDGKIDVIEQLRLYQPLFVLLDAARDPRIVELVREADGECQALYEGGKAVELAAFAPYLLALDPSAKALTVAVEQGWGESWGVYLSSREPFSAVRLHLRRFLMVKQPDGQQVYFRFYDPRVLRAFIPGLNIEEQHNFFGPIDCFLVEGGPSADILVFQPAAA